MYCPLNGKHRLIEIAPALWQCPKCGFGPNREGYFYFWAVSYVEIIDHEGEALAVRYDTRLDAYVASQLQWLVDEEERVVPGTIQEELVEYISTRSEKEESPLPAIHNSTVGGDTPRPKLPHLGWSSPLGQKVL